MKLTKNSIKRKVKSTINPFYGKRGPGAKAGRAAIKAGSGFFSAMIQLTCWMCYWMWLMIKWMSIGTWLLFKGMFYTFPKFLIQKFSAHKEMNNVEKTTVKDIDFETIAEEVE